MTFKHECGVQVLCNDGGAYEMSTLSRGGEILYILGRKCTAHHGGVATVELTQLAYQKWVVRMSVAVFGCRTARHNSFG